MGCYYEIVIGYVPEKLLSRRVFSGLRVVQEAFWCLLCSIVSSIVRPVTVKFSDDKYSARQPNRTSHSEP